MAMNKTEQAYVKQLEQRLAELEVLVKRPELIKPDVPPPGHGSRHGSLTKGWLYNIYSKRVEPACSTSTGHAFGRNDRTTTQNPRWLYSTESLAYRAMQAEMEEQMLKELGQIEMRIKQAETREKKK
jgi:hypothetical protein